MIQDVTEKHHKNKSKHCNNHVTSFILIMRWPNSHELSVLTAAKAYETKFLEHYSCCCILNNECIYQNTGSCNWEEEERTLERKRSRITYYSAKLIYFNSSLEEKYFRSFNIFKDGKNCNVHTGKKSQIKIGCKKI